MKKFILFLFCVVIFTVSFAQNETIQSRDTVGFILNSDCISEFCFDDDSNCYYLQYNDNYDYLIPIYCTKEQFFDCIETKNNFYYIERYFIVSEQYHYKLIKNN